METDTKINKLKVRQNKSDGRYKIYVKGRFENKNKQYEDEE